MIIKFVPKSAPQILLFMRNVFNKAQTYPNKAIMPLVEDCYNLVAAFLPKIEKETHDVDVALYAQTKESKLKWLAFDRAVIFCNHFYKAFQNGVIRGAFDPSERQLLGLDVNNGNIPVIKTENDLQYWATYIKNGEAARIAAGCKAMANPSAAEVDIEYQVYFAHAQSQTTLKETTDKEQEEVTGILAEGYAIAKDVCDELEHKFRHDPDSSRRDKCREWGIIYKIIKQDAGGEIIEPLTGTVAPQAFAIILQGGFDANTTLFLTNNGPVTVQFYTGAQAGNPGSGAVVEIGAGMQREVFASELGAEGNTLLMVYNPDESTAGNWEVVVGE